MEPDHNAGYVLGKALLQLGAKRAYGVMGGNIARLVSGLEAAGVDLVHTRHETGAAFMAAEESLYTGRPAVVYVTTGPGWANALNGLVAGTYEGAKVIALSGASEHPVGAPTRGVEAGLNFQPQNGGGLTALRALAAPHARVVFSLPRCRSELYRVLDEWHSGLQAPCGFLGCALVPVSLQKESVPPWELRERARQTPVGLTDGYFADLATQLDKEETVVWVGWGARHHTELVRDLIERLDARVVSSPRAKGVYPERDHRYLGVTGHGAHRGPLEYFGLARPSHLLVLGTRLSELTAYWDVGYTPKKSVIHVDTDPRALTGGFLRVPHTAVVSDLGTFLERLLIALSGTAPSVRRRQQFSGLGDFVVSPSNGERIHPSRIIQAVQARVLDLHPETFVVAEGGNAWAWGPNGLRFEKPRWRLSTNWASMGHFAAGTIGLALACARPTVAMVGDCAMLMQSEINTAVKYRAQVKWLVWNDSGYGMIRHGLSAIDLPPMDVGIPRIDFAKWAAAQGACGIRVNSGHELDEAIDEALSTDGPVVIDLPIDPSIPPPFGQRNNSLSDEADGGEWSGH